jgi:hypothetical protein
MSEYITGRVKLSSCHENKAIYHNRHKDANLLFVLDDDQSIVVDSVPGHYGVRAGSKVRGVISPGSNKISKMKWPKKSKAKKGVCSLEELMKENNVSKKDDTLVFQTPCTYCTHIVKVDTKDYGLPQTRQRKYMFIWKPKNNDVHDDLGYYWEVRFHNHITLQCFNLFIGRVLFIITHVFPFLFSVHSKISESSSETLSRSFYSER